MNNMKMMWRNITSPLSLAYPNICVGSWAGSKYNRIPKKFPSLYLLTGIATLLIGSIPKSQTITAS